MQQRRPFHLACAILPLRLRRKVLRAVWWLSYLAGRGPNLGLDPLFQRVLKVSRRDAARLERELAYQDMIAVTEWAALIRRNKDQMQRDAQSIRFEDPAILERLARTERPIILAPLHMGCFALPFAKLMLDYFSKRPMLILRAREDRPEETLAMQRIAEIGVDMRFLNVSQKQHYVDAVRFARAGAIIVCFVDLPASYGGPIDCSLFYTPARIAMGLDALARLTDAIVLPLSVHSTSGGDVVRFGRPFESAETGAVERRRVTEIVRRHIESAVLSGPEQWHMWPRFAEFACEPTREAAA